MQYTILKIVYDGSPKELDTALEIKVQMLIAAVGETNEDFAARKNLTVTVPFTTPCTNIGNSISAIKTVVAGACLDYLNDNFNTPNQNEN